MNNKTISEVLKDEEGITAIEYSLIAFLIAVVIVFSITAVGNEVLALFNKVATAVQVVL